MLTGAGLIRVADAQSTPVISAGGVTNAAAAKTILARGGLATIYGSNFTSSASTTFQAQMTPFPLVLGGVSVTVGGATAPLYYVSSTQINFQTPFQVPAGASVNVVVTVNNVASAPATVAIADYAVAVFGYFRTASAYDPIIVHSLDNSLVTPANPAVPNETLVVYATGIGKLTNAPASGAVAPGPPLLAQAVDTPAATVGGAAAQVIFAGLTPGSVGLAQFDITLPANIASGSLPLVIQFPGDSSPLVNLAVKGNIQGTPLLTLSPASLAYGNVTVGQASDLTVNVINTGSATLTVNSISASAGFSVVSPATPVNVAPGATQTIDVRFAPSGAGPISGTLSIASNAAGSPVSVSLSGTGVAAVAPGISLSASSLSFGTVASGQASSQSVTINNPGNAALIVSSITTTAPFSVVSPPTPFTVAAGGSSTVTVQFAPTATNPYTATLSIASNAAGSPASVALSGTGTPAVSLACGFTLGPDIDAKWLALGGLSGVLGCPTANESEATMSPQGTTGRTAPFVNGLIYWHRNGPFAGQSYEMHNCVPSSYAGVNLSGGAFGFPVSDTYTVDGGFRSDFQGGYIVGPTGSFNCGAFSAGGDFTGVWATDRGPTTIVQDSIDVTGMYGDSGGIFTGYIAGTSMSLYWQEPSGLGGSGTFLLSSDGSSFAGNYSSPTASALQWNGTRVAVGSVGWFTPSRIDFGTVAVNTSETRNVVASAPQVALTLQNFSTDNPAFQVTVGSSQLLPGGSSLIPIKFTPSASGPVSGNLTILTTDLARPQVTIQLVGTGK